MTKEEIRKEVENIMCECDPDSCLDDVQMDAAINKITEFIENKLLNK